MKWRILIAVMVFGLAALVLFQPRVSGEDEVLKPEVVRVPKQFGKMRSFNVVGRSQYIAVFEEEDGGTIRVVRISPNDFGKGVTEIEIRRTE